MHFEAVFTSAIEVGIAIAGFSGIAIALGQHAEGDWTPSDLGRVSILLQSSGTAILLAFLALILDGAGVPSRAAPRSHPHEESHGARERPMEETSAAQSPWITRPERAASLTWCSVRSSPNGLVGELRRSWANRPGSEG